LIEILMNNVAMSKKTTITTAFVFLVFFSKIDRRIQVQTPEQWTNEQQPTEVVKQ